MTIEMQINEMARNIAMRAMDEQKYKGKTLREWIDLILAYADERDAPVRHDEGIGTSFVDVKNVDEWQDRIILDEGDESKRCRVYYQDMGIVRCKDCGWRKKNTFCLRHGHYVKDDYFCADGGDPNDDRGQ